MSGSRPSSPFSLQASGSGPGGGLRPFPAALPPLLPCLPFPSHLGPPGLVLGRPGRLVGRPRPRADGIGQPGDQILSARRRCGAGSMGNEGGLRAPNSDRHPPHPPDPLLMRQGDPAHSGSPVAGIRRDHAGKEVGPDRGSSSPPRRTTPIGLASLLLGTGPDRAGRRGCRVLGLAPLAQEPGPLASRPWPRACPGP